MVCVDFECMDLVRNVHKVFVGADKISCCKAATGSKSPAPGAQSGS